MAPTFKKIQTIEVGAGGSASIDFTSIPSTYTDLCIEVSARLSSTDSAIKTEFNGVTTGYSWRRIYGNGSAASSLSGTDAYYLHGDTSSMTASTFSNSALYIPNYTGSSNKIISIDTALETNATSGELFMLAALWSNSAVISRITLTPLTGSFVQFSSATLYGIKNS